MSNPACAKFLYVIATETGEHKIGVSVNPMSRLKQLQTALPMKLALIHTTEQPMDNAEKVEAYAHWLLRESHVHGEWFRITNEAALVAITAATEAIRMGMTIPKKRVYSVQEAFPKWEGMDADSFISTLSDLGIRQKDAADLFQCDVATIRRWQDRGPPPSAGMILAYLAATGTTPEAFMETITQTQAEAA